MKSKECRLESQVMEGLKLGNLSPELHEHAGECEICKDSLELFQWMNQFKTSTPAAAEFELPSADAIWENAFKRESSRRHREIERKAMLPILIFQSFAIVVSLGVVALFLIPNLGSLGQFFNSWFGAGNMLDSILSIVKTVAHSFSYLLIPLGIGISSLLISGIAVALTPRKNL